MTTPSQFAEIFSNIPYCNFRFGDFAFADKTDEDFPHHLANRLTAVAHPAMENVPSFIKETFQNFLNGVNFLSPQKLAPWEIEVVPLKVVEKIRSIVFSFCEESYAEYQNATKSLNEKLTDSMAQCANYRNIISELNGKLVDALRDGQKYKEFVGRSASVLNQANILNGVGLTFLATGLIGMYCTDKKDKKTRYNIFTAAAVGGLVAIAVSSFRVFQMFQSAKSLLVK